MPIGEATIVAEYDRCDFVRAWEMAEAQRDDQRRRAHHGTPSTSA